MKKNKKNLVISKEKSKDTLINLDYNQAIISF